MFHNCIVILTLRQCILQMCICSANYCTNNTTGLTQVEGLDEDNAQVMVKLTLSRNMATASQYVVKLVSKKEYDKYSKYLSEYHRHIS